ncbi:MAG TPA: hypothetical protein VNH14_12830 [Gemmatimonadales bacterium]|nr:hypothetical protein [Gemmatimonadales bacterium]
MSDPRERKLPVLRQQGWEQHRSNVEGTFALGRLFATPGALRAVVESGDDLFPYLARHARGDWGDVDNEDWLLNDQAVRAGTRLLSAYRLRDGTRIWIITEADRSATTLLRPDEY